MKKNENIFLSRYLFQGEKKRAKSHFIIQMKTNWKHIYFQVSFAAGHGERRNPPSRLQGIEKNMKFLS